MERCTLSRLRADLATSGKWTRNATLAPPYALPAQHHFHPSNPEHDAFQWEWSAEPSSPCTLALPTGTRPALALCGALQRHGVSRVLFVGDSLQFMMAESLFQMVRGKADSATFERRRPFQSSHKAGASDVLRCEGAPPIELRMVRNDMLGVDSHTVRPRCENINMPERSCLCAGNPPPPRPGTPTARPDEDAVPLVVGDWDSFCWPWLETYAGSNATTLLVLAPSLHHHTLASFKRTFDALLPDLAYAHTARQRRGLRDLVVMRTAVPGHGNCLLNSQPTATPGPFISTQYEWDRIPSMNSYMRSRLPAGAESGSRWRRAAAGPRAGAPSEPHEAFHAEILDVSAMTLLRPDGHVRPVDSKQVTELHMRPDCLHYALPGVPDAWNYALLATLLRMG